MNGWVDPNDKPVPRYCDPDRFGISELGGWQPFAAKVQTIVCACGHTQHLAIGVKPGEGEEDRWDTAQAMAEQLEQGPCLSCRPSRAREVWGRGRQDEPAGPAACEQRLEPVVETRPEPPRNRFQEAWKKAEREQRVDRKYAEVGEPIPEQWSRRKPKNGQPRREKAGRRR